jgi:EamA domain-containing membrane protein RarD
MYFLFGVFGATGKKNLRSLDSTLRFNNPGRKQSGFYFETLFSSFLCFIFILNSNDSSWSLNQSPSIHSYLVLTPCTYVVTPYYLHSFVLKAFEFRNPISSVSPVDFQKPMTILLSSHLFYHHLQSPRCQSSLVVTL